MASTWDGNGLSQEDFMAKDECIVLNNDDEIVGHASKLDCHIFSPEQPKGILHRAFSVFLFDKDDRLLLQQRASSKITFPDVWTNSCCSHPLSGQSPSEVDSPNDVANGTVMGAKRAAVRKLAHELGIHPNEVPLEDFKFLTRLHYWAADTVTHGPQSKWGEHEIDYILFIKCPNLTREAVLATANAGEVRDVKFVDKAELMAGLNKNDGTLWSPWFRIIAQRFLAPWWDHLDETLTTDRFFDPVTIHRFDPPLEHCGGAGNAQRGHMTDNNNNNSNKQQIDATKKQGGYGKVITHKESVLSQLVHVDEVVAAVRLKVAPPFANKVPIATSNDPDVVFCGEMLAKVSRSFAAVILQLPDGLCKEVMVFYLVLRALDTIEDDMEAFLGNPLRKLSLLRTFHETALVDHDWDLQNVGEGDEKLLLEQFYRVGRVFRSLSPAMQAIIKDITRRMGFGMAEFVQSDLGQGTKTVKEYDLYCHYVAGLVGLGLSQMFAESTLESKAVGSNEELSNSMGLFLQKTNIIRDYLEDYVDGRAFWPQEVWQQFGQDLGDFSRDPRGAKSKACLNTLITNALKHVPDCLRFLENLNHPDVFRFCAIPQVMAICTLDKCFNNEDVFTGVVKIRKGLACKLILSCNSLDSVRHIFNHYAKSIANKVDETDPSAKTTLEHCAVIEQLTKEGEENQSTLLSNKAVFTVAVAGAVGAAVFASRDYWV